MPELPEVETIRRSLEPKLIGKTIVGTEVLLSKLIQNQSVAEFESQIKGQKINNLSQVLNGQLHQSATIPSCRHGFTSGYPA